LADCEVRNAEESDLDEICKIEDESFPEPFPRGLFEKLLRDKNALFFVAVEAGLILGYCIATLENHRGHLISIAVGQSHRRRGVAVRLLGRLLHELEYGDTEQVWLEVRPDNIAAVSLYRKLGFLKAGSAPNYYRDGTDALIMYRPIPRTEATDR